MTTTINNARPATSTSKLLGGFRNATFDDCIKVKDDSNNTRPKTSSQHHRSSSNNNNSNSNSRPETSLQHQRSSSKQIQQHLIDSANVNADNFWNSRLSKKPSKWGTSERSKQYLQRPDDRFKFGECTKDWQVSTESGSSMGRLKLASTLNKYADGPPPGEYIPRDYVVSKQEKFPSHTLSGRNFAPVEVLEQFPDLRSELEIIQSKTKTLPSPSPIKTMNRPKTVPPRMPQPNPFLTPTPPPGSYDLPGHLEEKTKYERPGSVKMNRSKSKQRVTLDFDSLNVNESKNDQKAHMPGPLTYTKNFSKYLYKQAPIISISGNYTNPMYTKETIKPGPLDYDVTKVYESGFLSPTSTLTKKFLHEPVIFKKQPLFQSKREHIPIIQNTQNTMIEKSLSGLNKYNPIIGPFYMKNKS
jgi:hypothetical protein